jgi:sugar/nucleoside kinase (ribokinase family)
VLVVGTLAHHLAHGASLQDAMRKAVECASISVTRKGAQESYPTPEELLSLGLVSNLEGDKGTIRKSLGLED